MSNDVPNDPSPADDNPFQPHRKHGTNPDEWLNSAAVYVRMMIDANNYHAGYAEGLVLVTHKELQVSADQPKKKKGMTAESIAKMEQEMETLESGMKAITENYKENMFTLQTASTYIKALLKNTRVAKYLKAKHAEIATEFQNMAAAEAV